MEILSFFCRIIMLIQLFCSYGTAYRLTKKNGDNGTSLFGFLLVLSIASAIPGLGFYLWYKFKDY